LTKTGKRLRPKIWLSVRGKIDEERIFNLKEKGQRSAAEVPAQKRSKKREEEENWGKSFISAERRGNYADRLPGKIRNHWGGCAPKK